MVPSQLLWEMVKGHNSFLRKNINGTIFSAEPGNLYNKHSYKYSGEQSHHLVLENGYSTCTVSHSHAQSGAAAVSVAPGTSRPASCVGDEHCRSSIVCQASVACCQQQLFCKIMKSVSVESYTPCISTSASVWCVVCSILMIVMRNCLSAVTESN